MHTGIENQIKDFRNYLIQLGYSKGSYGMLPRCIRSFVFYAGATDTSELTSFQIQGFYEYLHSSPNKKTAGGLSDQYIHHHVYSLKVFFNWLEQTGQIKTNPMSVMKFKAPKTNPREPLSQTEIQLLFEGVLSLKERAVLHLFYSCGLRRSEAEVLNIGDVHFRKQVLYVREGKGNKRRAVPMPYRVCKELEVYYLSERITQSGVKDREAFILNRVGLRMRGLSYNRLLKAMLERAGLKKEITLHHLRHSIATHLLESGLGIERVRDFLGHRHLEATQVYAKVNQGQLSKI